MITKPRSKTRYSSCRLLLEFSDSFYSCFLRPTRTLLVLLAYALGVAALISATAVTASTTASVVDRLTSAASTQLLVSTVTSRDQPWTPNDPQGSAALAASLRLRDQLRSLEGVSNATAVRTFTNVQNRITRGPSSAPITYRGAIVMAEASYLSSKGISARSGDLSLLDHATSTPAVVLGATAAASLDIRDALPGQMIWLNGYPVVVIALGSETRNAAADDAIYLSAGTMPFLADQLNSWIEVTAMKGYGEPLAKAIPLALSPVHPGDITVTAVSNLSQLQAGITNDLGRLLSIIGWALLALSTLSASTTMYLAVHQRKAEIALRRAMGGSRASIRRLFIWEGLFIGTAGGISGSSIGVALSAFLARLLHQQLCLGIMLPLRGLAVGVIAGAIASLLPAVHAARQDPAGILRAA